MDTDEKYLELQTRLTKANQTRAVLVAKEEEKGTQREALVEKLKAVGIDTDNLEEETKRLEKEESELLEDAEKNLETYESALERLTTGQPPEVQLDETESTLEMG